MGNNEQDINEQLAKYKKLAQERANKALAAFKELEDAFQVVESIDLTINGKPVKMQLSKRGIVSISHTSLEEGKATFDSFKNLHS